MNLPKQVQEQERKANEALDRIRQGGTPPAGNEAPPQQEPIAQAPAPDWEARYRALQGKYNAEVPRLSELVKSQQEQIEAARREIEALKSRPPAADTRIDLTASLPEEVRDRYDPEMLQTMAQIAQQAAEKEAKEAREEAERARQERLQRSDALLTEQRKAEMLDALDDLSPDWRVIDKSPGFVAYLNQPDPATGKHLRDTLNAAVQRFDAATAARIFNRFAMTALPQTPAAPPTPSLESQRVPEIAGAGLSAPAGDKRIFTKAEAKAEYTRAAGLVISNPKRAAEIEREIDLAHAEGRIR
jgi:hypothetical protein